MVFWFHVIGLIVGATGLFGTGVAFDEWRSTERRELAVTYAAAFMAACMMVVLGFSLILFV